MGEFPKWMGFLWGLLIIRDLKISLSINIPFVIDKHIDYDEHYLYFLQHRLSLVCIETLETPYKYTCEQNSCIHIAYCMSCHLLRYDKKRQRNTNIVINIVVFILL